MVEPAAQPGRSPGRAGAFPRPPAHAWGWFQRSRPVLAEAARRLTGGPAPADFVARLRRDFDTDPFVRDVVISVVADVAFRGRLPARRPPGASWDRGLLWWAAALAGVSPAAFEARSASPAGEELRLFDAPDADPAHRGRLIARLRQLLASAEGDQVPASAVRQLLAELEDG